MGMAEKIAKAKPTSWVVDGLSKTDLKSTVELARIFATIERKRLDKGMTQSLQLLWASLREWYQSGRAEIIILRFGL